MNLLRAGRALARTRLLHAVAAGAGVSILSVASTAESTPSTFTFVPPNPGWTAALLGGAPLTDPEGDTAGSRDIVGSASDPLLFVASDATHIYFRLRVDSDPRQNATNFAPFGWGCFIDTDADSTTYEYSTLLNGVNNPDEIDFFKNTTTTTPNSPDDPPEQTLSSVLSPLALTVAHAEIVVAPSMFGGDTDYYIDWAVDLSAATAGGYDPTKPARFYCGSSNNGTTIGADCSGGTASGCPLSSQFSDPVVCGPLGCGICGDGTLAAAEACDDGNLASGDGCNSVCLVENGFTCVDSGDCASGNCDPGSHVCAPPDDPDGDGLSTSLEDMLGLDPNDADSDDDGVIDGQEVAVGVDSDGDGLINGLDPDSDDDGLWDGTELGLGCAATGTDTNAGHCTPDADAGATKTNPLLADTDLGGVSDGVEDTNLDGAVDAGERDPLDPTDDLPPADADNDGLVDGLELTIGTDPNDADSDDDGVPDGEEVDLALDTDGDGLINALDPDSDDDGLYDGTELGLDCSAPGTDASAGHCIADGDAGATKTNPIIADTDAGSVPDGSEDANHDGVVDAGETDPNDGADDVPPTDTDGDGLPDAVETAIGTLVNDADSDNDGVPDGQEANYADDTDGDGLINALDPDSDDDGLYDGTEVGLDCGGAGTDVSAGHCIPDADAGVTTTSMVDADTDDGGVADGSEDLDHDGAIDAGETDPNNGLDDVVLDTDGDGLTDLVEVAIGTAVDDADSDNDGVPDGQEANYADDTDGDGLINALDPDSDGDGLFDGTELGLGCSNPDTDTTAGNCIADGDAGATKTSMVDADTDDGGVSDGAEDANHDGVVDAGETDPNDGSDDGSMGTGGGGAGGGGNGGGGTGGNGTGGGAGGGGTGGSGTGGNGTGGSDTSGIVPSGSGLIDCSASPSGSAPASPMWALALAGAVLALRQRRAR